jgi:hypothetical protein
MLRMALLPVLSGTNYNERTQERKPGEEFRSMYGSLLHQFSGKACPKKETTFEHH